MKAIVLAVSLTALAAGQGPTDPGSPFALLGKEKVRQELKLTPAQSAAIQKLLADARGDPKEAARAYPALNKALQPVQQKRLKEIGYQVRGGAAVGDGDVMKTLGLSDKQKGEVRSLWAASEKELQNKLAVSRFVSAQARLQFIAKHRRAAGARLLGVLNDDQKKAFEKLKGRAFDTAGLDSD